MATSNPQSGQAVKDRYSTPALTIYGSVRDLTGSISGGAGDGGAGMQMP